jgi:hypothetical protein
VDLAYPLREGGRPGNDDLEMRLSLRSIHKHLRLPLSGRVFLYGHRPRWLTENAVHVPMRDPSDKAMNLRAKYEAMVEDERLSDPFLLLDDDHVFLQETTSIAMPVSRQSLERLAAEYGGRTHGTYLRNCLEALRANGLSERNFQLHYPILVRKEVLALAVALMDRPMVMGSLYGNLQTGPRFETDRDFKCNGLNDWRRLRSGPFVSLSDSGMRRHPIRHWVEGLFPERSPWEAPARRSEVMRAGYRYVGPLPSAQVIDIR